MPVPTMASVRSVLQAFHASLKPRLSLIIASSSVSMGVARMPLVAVAVAHRAMAISTVCLRWKTQWNPAIDLLCTNYHLFKTKL